MEDNKGEVIAVSGPSGAGKSTIVKIILKLYPEIVFSVSATTRPKRENESDGVEYFFISEDKFKNKIDKGEFVEWQKFYDYYYGTVNSFINENINSGNPVLLEIDVKGALSIKRIYPESHLIYIMPPSYEVLVSRLRNRQTETEEDFQKRIERAKMELSHKDQFDYIVINEYIEKAVEETVVLIKKIINKEK
ncbi:MAG: guanylate kinase [Bacteroidetes bacterium]|nr:guanylate kinase [Bacteroidota bacterium]